jgi:hypothetical protein
MKMYLQMESNRENLPENVASQWLPSFDAKKLRFILPELWPKLIGTSRRVRTVKPS